MDVDQYLCLSSSPMKRIRDYEQQLGPSPKIQRMSVPTLDKTILWHEVNEKHSTPLQTKMHVSHDLQYGVLDMHILNKMHSGAPRKTESNYNQPWHQSTTRGNDSISSSSTFTNKWNFYGKQHPPSCNQSGVTNYYPVNALCAGIQQLPAIRFPAPKVHDRKCPDCAAGKSGHIRHIGRWRLMDSP